MTTRSVISGNEFCEGSPTKFCYDYVIPTSISALCHPFVSARTLMMLGHEFEPPKLGRTVLGFKRYMYPNVFVYLRYLREDVGIYQLFTVGLTASICGSAAKSVVCDFYLKKNVDGYHEKKSVIQTDRGFFVFMNETCKLTVGRCLGLIVSYPFQVIMIRQIAQFVGKETIYTGILQTFIEISTSKGSTELFSGFLPRLLGEIITVWLSAGFAYVLNQFILSEGVDPKIKEHTPYIASLVVSSCTHRLTVTSTVMAVTGSGLAVSLPFNSSVDCYNYLSTRNAFVRGASFFFRYASGPM